jgi:hypothetical protein
MRGDFSRDTFDTGNGYRAVLMQQGRVVLDADWNEQADITAHHDEVRTLDVVGRSGGVAGAPGSGPGSFAVVGPDGAAPKGAAWEELFVTAGRYYVDGVLCEAFPPAAGAPGWPLVDQPHLPAVAGEPGLPEPPESEGDGRYALYLDVWDVHVTADEEPSLHEPALGGPDTSTRRRTVWQVRSLPIAKGTPCSDLHAPDWLARTPRRMSAGLREVPPEADPCRITTGGGYSRLENQLYRVQVHDTGSGSSARFLWSRENGSVVAGLRALDLAPSLPGAAAVLTLDRQGRDAELSIRENDLVEVTGPDLELRRAPGFLARGGVTSGLELPITWVGPAPTSLDALGRSPVVRRWEGGPTTAGATAAELEDGISVRFPTGGTPRTGDHWLIPARTVRMAHGLAASSGTILWPTEGSGTPVALPPFGPRSSVCPLAVLVRTGGRWTLETDCRRRFPALTEMVSLDLLGGDGQEAMPENVLPEPVRVAVRNGGLPVEGASVQFSTGHGTLAVTPPGSNAPRSLPVTTGPDGVAAVRWRLSPTGPTTQKLTAHQLNDAGKEIGAPVVVSGRLSVATQVAWDPVCDGLKGTRTVQDALGRLATTTELRLLGGDGQHVQRRGAVLPQPVRVQLDSPCGPFQGGAVLATTAREGGLLAQAKEGESAPDDLTGRGETGKVVLKCGADGVAAVWWQPDFGKETSDTLEFSVEESKDAPVRVGAQLLPAVGRRTGGVHITEVRLSSGKPFLNDEPYPFHELASGFVLGLDGPVVQASVQDKPVVRVEVDLPWPFGTDGAAWGVRTPVGYRTTELAGQWNADGPLIVWGPRSDASNWLTQVLPSVLGQQGYDQPLAARLLVDGWAVVSEDDPTQHLNGHASVVMEGERSRLQLPTDDEVAGGQFVQWFWLVP